MVTTMDNFLVWLNNKIRENDWSQRELAKRAGISHSAIANVMSGLREPTLDFCKAMAKAFNERPETVLRIAGLLPTSVALVDDLDEEEGELIELWRSVPPGDAREFLIRLVRMWAKENAGKGY